MSRPKKKWSWKERAFLLGILLVFLAGFSFLMSPVLEHQLISSRVNHYRQVSAKEMQENKKKKANFSNTETQNLSVQQLVLNQMNAQALPVIGEIAYPRLGIYLPIFNGDDYSTMCYGAGSAKANQEMGEGNYALASHNVFGDAETENLLFGPLKQAQEGDLVYLTDKEKVYEYHVDSLSQVTVDQGEVINDHAGKKELTLYTCVTYQGPLRWLVKGSLVKVSAFDGQSAGVFNQGYTKWW